MSKNSKSGYKWATATILIGLGIGFLLQNVGLIQTFPENWWAFFILLAAVVNFWIAWKCYRTDGARTSKVNSHLIGGMATLIVAVLFLFNLNWEKLWPVWLIFGGLSMLLRGSLPAPVKTDR